MTISKNFISIRRSVIWQLLLTITPWLVLWLLEEFNLWAMLFVMLFGPSTNVPACVILAPFEVLLVVGVIIAWRYKFPHWSYTWIGTLYFFGYREIFQIVLTHASEILPQNPDVLIHSFYWLVNPLALAVLLALITRRDWLFACLTAYPYTSIIQAWWTLDSTPFHICLISLIFYTSLALVFFNVTSRALKFLSLLAGTLLIGVGFYIYRWDVLIEGLTGFIFMMCRLILILFFPLILHMIPLYHRLFRTAHLRRAVS